MRSSSSRTRQASPQKVSAGRYQQALRSSERHTCTSNGRPVGFAMDPSTKVKCPAIDPVLPRGRFVQL